MFFPFDHLCFLAFISYSRCLVVLSMFIVEVIWEVVWYARDSAMGNTNSSDLGAGMEQRVLEVSSRCLLQSVEPDFRKEENQSSRQRFEEIGLCSSVHSTEGSDWIRRKERRVYRPLRFSFKL